MVLLLLLLLILSSNGTCEWFEILAAKTRWEKNKLGKRNSGNETDKSGTYPGVVPFVLYIIWYNVINYLFWNGMLHFTIEKVEQVILECPSITVVYVAFYSPFQLYLKFGRVWNPSFAISSSVVSVLNRSLICGLISFPTHRMSEFPTIKLYRWRHTQSVMVDGYSLRSATIKNIPMAKKWIFKFLAQMTNVKVVTQWFPALPEERGVTERGLTFQSRSDESEKNESILKLVLH